MFYKSIACLLSRPSLRAIHAIAVTLLCLLGLTQSACAQTADEVPAWEVMRIFMPESLDNVVPRDYLTFPLSELETLLSDDARRRQQSTGQAAGIQRATYVARWSDQLLVSGASLWQTIRPSSASPLTIGRTSLAIDDPTGMTGEVTPLTRHLRYLDDNRLQLGGGEGERDYWFGFRAKARRRDSGQQTLELTLPRALLATMLLSVPQQTTLTSNLPCMRVEDPSQFLPRDWPTSAMPILHPGDHWYVLLLSGRDTCTLNLSPTRQSNQYPFRLSVASAQSEILAQPSGMNVTSRFQLSKPPNSGSLRVTLDDPLHVRSIQINGTESTNWHSIIDEVKLVESTSTVATGANSTGANATNDTEAPLRASSAEPRSTASRTIEIPCDGVGTGPMVLTISAVARMSLPYDATLPKVEIVDAFVLDGRCSLSAQDRIQIEDVQTVGQRLTNNSTGSASTWQWQWTGKTPSAMARIKAMTNQWTVRSLARFSLQKDVVVATAHVNVSSANVQGNQVALQLAQGWFVDSVQIENAPLGVAVDMRESESRESELSLHWEERRSDLDARIIVNAHHHQRTEVDELQLPSTRIVSLPGADQQDTYVIEQSGRFQLTVNPELLRMRVSEDELPGWQRTLVSRLADAWIFRSSHSDLPAIHLERIRAMLETRLHTTIQATDKQATVTYRVACNPISGSINQLKLLLPIPADAVAPSWSLARRFDGSMPKGLQVTSLATSSSTGETFFTIELSQDVSEEFQIEAELHLPIQQETPNDAEHTSSPDPATAASHSPLIVPLPSIPQSVSQDTVVVLPPGYQLPVEVDALEILPDGLCCSEGQLVDSTTNAIAEGLTNFNSENFDRIVAARYDPNAVTHLHLVRSRERSDGAWVHEQLHQHWQHPGGRTTHRSTWQLTLAEPLSLDITLPANWKFESLLVNGRLVTPETKSGLRVRLPGSDTLQLDLKCSSQQKDGWSPWLVFEQPDLGLPVLQSRELVWFPGDTYAGQGWTSTNQFSASVLITSAPGVSQSGTDRLWPIGLRLSPFWMNRLWPGMWWHWISPAALPRVGGLRSVNTQSEAAMDSKVAPTASKGQAQAPGASELDSEPSDVYPNFMLIEERPIRAKSVDAAFWWALPLEPTAAQSIGPRVWWIDTARVACMALALSLTCAGGWLVLCGRSLQRWWLAWMALVALLILIPDWALMPAHSAALGLAAATLLRLCHVVVQISKPTTRRNGDSVYAHFKASSFHASSPRLKSNAALTTSTTSPTVTTPAVTNPNAGSANTASTNATSSPINSSNTSLLLLSLTLCSFAADSTAWAQPFSKNASRDREEIFGILIPVDAENKVAGDLVYVPTRLYSLLNNASQPDYKSGSVSITAAFYSLNVLNDPISLTSSVGEITAELNVQANRAEAELRLPFRRDELQLQRAYVDSSSLIVGERLRQDADQIVWRASDTERHTLRLVFRPKTITMKDGRGSLSVGIPAIPTAKLDVMGDDLRDVSVESIGGIQLDSPRSLVARLGPINKLSINWPLILGRSSSVQVQSDTWLHTRGEQVIVLCQLKVRGSAALPSALHVVGDNNWVPVGSDWEDYRMLSKEGVTASGRPVYTVERSAETGADTLTLRVLLLPKADAAPSVLSIPFLAFQEVAAQQRTLAISHGESAMWKASGTESFQPLLSSQSVSIWEKARLAEQPTLFKVPTGSLLATLSRVPSTATPTVSEVTEISLQSPELKLKYSARWSQPLVGKSSIRFQIPSWLRVDGAYVDSSPARFSQHPLTPEGVTNELNVLVDGNLGGLHSIHLQLAAPVVLNKPWRLPHLVLQDAKIESSLLQVYRGAELQSELRTIGDAPPMVDRTDLRPSPLLLNLHSLIAQMELGEGYRDEIELPVEVRLARAPASRRAHAVMRLMRSDQGWRAQLDAIVDVAPGEANHIFLDLPRSLEASIREPVEVNVPMMLWPSADANRAILCVMPPAGSGPRTHVTLTFRLPTAGASQSIMIPDIRFLGLSIERPALALPKSIAGQLVRWSQVGRALPAQWLQHESLQELGLDEFFLHEAGGSQLQAAWHTSDREEQGARLLLTRVALKKDSHPEIIQGHIGYWIEPRNQAYLTVTLPQNCQLVGALAGNAPVPWNQTEDHKLRVLMQPSYLPVRIHLFVKWTDMHRVSSSELQLPLPQLSARSGGPVLIGTCDPSQSKTPERAWHIGSSSRLSDGELNRLLARSLASTLILSSPTAADRDAEELRAWLPHWNPIALGIDESTLVAVPAPPTIRKTNGNSDEEVRTTLGEFWADYLTKRFLADAPAVAAQRDRSEHALSLYAWYQLPESSSTTQLTMELEPRSTKHRTVQLALVALSWIVVAALTWLIGRRWIESLLSFTSELVWPVWLMLALAAGLLLPVVWPGIILLGCTLVVILRRYRELKRDHQFIFRPRPVR